MLEQLPFSFIFTAHRNGTLTVIKTVRIGGVTLAEGTVLSKGQIVGGIDWTQYIGHELGLINDNGIYVIREIY